MSILNQIELFLDGTYLEKEKKSFILKSRCICNYLERALDKKGFDAALSRINIHCSKDEGQVRVMPLKGVPFLEVCIKYELPVLFDLDVITLQRHYKKIIDLGLRAAETFMPVPHSYCMVVLQRFEEEAFNNKWIQSTKSWDRCSISSEVLACLTMEKFTLQQRIYRSDELISEKQIAETKPREMLFLDYLGSLSLDRSGNIVYKRKGKCLSKFDVKLNLFCDLAAS